jgi:hypothetical protein
MSAITGGIVEGRSAASAANRSSAMPFAITWVRAGAAPSSICRCRLPSYREMMGLACR